jgi:hypothetical protein
MQPVHLSPVLHPMHLFLPGRDSDPRLSARRQQIPVTCSDFDAREVLSFQRSTTPGAVAGEHVGRPPTSEGHELASRRRRPSHSTLESAGCGGGSLLEPPLAPALPPRACPHGGKEHPPGAVVGSRRSMEIGSRRGGGSTAEMSTCVTSMGTTRASQWGRRFEIGDGATSREPRGLGRDTEELARLHRGQQVARVGCVVSASTCGVRSGDVAGYRSLPPLATTAPDFDSIPVGLIRRVGGHDRAHERRRRRER